MVDLTDTLAMAMRERIIKDMEKSFFFDTLTTSMAAPAKTLTQDDIRGWISALGEVRRKYVEPVDFIILDKQQQRRTPVVGYYHERAMKRHTKTKRQGRKCSRRKWKAMNRRQWNAHAIYAEPDDVLIINGKTIITPRQKRALEQATIRV